MLFTCSNIKAECQRVFYLLISIDWVWIAMGPLKYVSAWKRSSNKMCSKLIRRWRNCRPSRTINHYNCVVEVANDCPWYHSTEFWFRLSRSLLENSFLLFFFSFYIYCFLHWRPQIARLWFSIRFQFHYIFFSRCLSSLTEINHYNIFKTPAANNRILMAYWMGVTISYCIGRPLFID